MADLPSYPDSNDETAERTGAEVVRESTYTTPRWVKVFAIIAIVLVLLFVILHLAGVGFGGHTRP